MVKIKPELALGEEVEQVNSFLSLVALTTKYMSKTGKCHMHTAYFFVIHRLRQWHVKFHSPKKRFLVKNHKQLYLHM